MRVKIKEFAREQKGWSLWKLAQVMGIPQQSVYSWGSKRTQPSYLNMDKLCDVLDCQMSDLFEPEGVY